jgi:hypothetical protein
MPAALLGRVDPSEVPSGVAMTLSFGPHSAMVREMRLARRAKYRLLFRFVHRMALVGGQGGDDGLPNRHITTDLELGAFLPNDESGVAQNVIRLLEAGASASRRRSRCCGRSAWWTGTSRRRSHGHPVARLRGSVDPLRCDR